METSLVPEVLGVSTEAFGVMLSLSVAGSLVYTTWIYTGSRRLALLVATGSLVLSSFMGFIPLWVPVAVGLVLSIGLLNLVSPGP